MLRLYNSATRSIEKFLPLNPPKVGIYTCGPTVYQYAHIGNFRAYMTSDLLVRVLRQSGFDANFVMNITDVGHLVSDSDTGEDKLEKSAKREGKSAWDIATFYTDAFLRDYDALRFTRPNTLAKATDHIQEQIDLIKRLEEKGFTYVITDGVYFDTSKLSDYGKLSTLDKIKEGARVEINHEKKNPRDFALWKFCPSTDSGSKRDMEWESPWSPPGRDNVHGFPGWHIECSAMSMKYLGETFDIHTGGVDHISIHHTNEIAQSEAATGKEYVKYWIHTAFMLVNSQKMSKSLGNTYLLSDLITNGYLPIHLRYLYLQTQYRQEMNFTWESLEASKHTVDRLTNIYSSWKGDGGVSKEYKEKFLGALNEDLNTPQALAVMWEMVRSDIPEGAKRATFLEMDEILGLGFNNLHTTQTPIPEAVKRLLHDRDNAREQKDYQKADVIRAEIREAGFEIVDTQDGSVLKKL